MEARQQQSKTLHMRQAPGRAQALLIRGVKSAFALLLERVTEPRLKPEKGKRIEADDQHNIRERLSQS